MTDRREFDRPLAAFFLIAYGWTWGLAALLIFAPDWVARLTGPVGPQSPLFFVSVYAPTIAALLVTAFTQGGAGVKALLGRLVQWRFNPLVYAFVLFGIPFLATIAGHLGEYAMGIVPPAHTPRIWPFLSALPVALFLDPGPLGEELGWRGFALPRMLTRWKAPLATAMLGLIWGVWHYPAFKIPSLPQSGLNFPVFVVGAMVLSVIAGWLVIRARGSVLIAVLFHLAVNLSLGVFQPPFPMLVVVLGVVAVAILVLDRDFRAATGVSREPDAGSRTP